jgi:hypothetical protein
MSANNNGASQILVAPTNSTIISTNTDLVQQAIHILTNNGWQVLTASTNDDLVWELAAGLWRTNGADTILIPRYGPAPRIPRDELNRNDWKILRAMGALGAISSETSRTRVEICEYAGTGHHQNRSNRESFDHLRDLLLINATRNEGTWLTALGLAQLADRDA